MRQGRMSVVDFHAIFIRNVNKRESQKKKDHQGNLS